MGFITRIAKSLGLRRFEAASGGRRWANVPVAPNVNTAILASNTRIRERARPATYNNPWIANGVNVLVANLIGTGIVPQSQHPADATRTAQNKLWEAWVSAADPSGSTDFYGQQAQVARSLVVDGEIFAQLRPTGAGIVPFTVHLIPADQVDSSQTRELDNGGRVVAGVEFDANGVRTAYHMFRQPPGEAFASSAETIRVPAADVLHVFMPISVGQVRGVSWLAPILLRLTEIDAYEDAQLVRQKVSALFAAFVTDPDNSMGEGVVHPSEPGSPGGNSVTWQLESGTIKALPPGTDIKFSDPAEVGDVVQFLQMQLRAVAAGLGITYEQLTGDLTGVNYSSIRGGLLEFRRRLEQIQYNVIVHQFCRPIWQRFVTIAALSGRMQAPDFATNSAAYLTAKWITPGWPWIDPESDVRADAWAVQAGFKNRSEVVAARGYSAEEIDQEAARDAERAKKLGLVFTAPGQAQAPQSARQS